MGRETAVFALVALVATGGPALGDPGPADAALSRIEHLEKEALSSYDSNPDRARRWALEGARLASEHADASTHARMLRIAGGTLFLQSEHDEALRFYERALEVCGDDEACQGPALADISLVHSGRGHYVAAMDAVRQAMRACEGADTADCRATLVDTSRYAAHQQYRLGAFEETLTAARLAVQRGRRADMSVSRAQILVAKALAGLERPAEALKAAREARATAQQENRQSVVGSALVFEASLLTATGRPKDALARLDEARDVFTSLSKQRGLFNVETEAAHAWVALSDVARAKEHVERAELLAEQEDLRPLAYADLAQLRLVLSILDGQEEAALGQFERYDARMRALSRNRASTAMAEALAKVGAVERERELERLRHADAMNALRLSRQRALMGASIVIVVALVAMGALLERALRRVRAANATLAQQKVELSRGIEERERLLQEISHRVNGNLQIITSLIRVQSSRVGNAALSPDDQRQLLGDLERRVEAIALVHHELYARGSVSSVDLIGLLGRICDHLRRVLDYEGALEVVGPRDDLGLRLDVTRAVPASLVCGELVTNALAHARSGGVRASEARVEVRVERAGGAVDVTVRDAGKGIWVGGASEVSFGLRLAKQLARQLHGQIDFERAPEGRAGLCARLTFPHSSEGELTASDGSDAGTELGRIRSPSRA